MNWYDRNEGWFIPLIGILVIIGACVKLSIMATDSANLALKKEYADFMNSCMKLHSKDECEYEYQKTKLPDSQPTVIYTNTYVPTSR